MKKNERLIETSVDSNISIQLKELRREIKSQEKLDKSSLTKINFEKMTEENKKEDNHNEQIIKTDKTSINNFTVSDTTNNQGFFKRATHILRSAFSIDEQDLCLSEKKKKKLIITHIQSFQNYCVQEELKGNENSNFYFMQFMEIFLIHFGFFLFGIFIVPFYRILYGPQLIRNLGFWGKRMIYARNAQYSYWIIFIITIILTYKIHLAEYKADENNIPPDNFYKQYIYLTVSYMSIMLVFLRYLIVSIKYGFFPVNYYYDIKSKNLYKSNIRVNFLKHGWIDPDFYIINIYLKSAFNSVNINHKTFFLECVGEIKEDIISKIAEIEDETKKGQNRKRESYRRKIKKEKVSTFVVKGLINGKKSQFDSKSNKSSFILEDMKSQKPSPKDNQSISDNEINNYLGYRDSDNKTQSGILNEMMLDKIICKIDNNDTKSKISSDDSSYSSDGNNQSDIRKNNGFENNSTLHPSLKKLKNFVKTTLRQHILNLKKNEKKKKESLCGKIEFVNNNVYRINGLYLSKMIMKKINQIKFENYKILHIFLVFILLVIPITFVYKIYLLSLNKPSVQINGIGVQPIITNSTMNISQPIINGFSLIISNSSIPKIHPNLSYVNIDNCEEIQEIKEKNNQRGDYYSEIKFLKFNGISIILLIFSLISGIIPVWLNIENLIYGLIDFQRRRKTMEILYDIINPKNKDCKYDLPIINITNQETMLNWYTLRSIMMRYGKRFTDRIMIQTSVFGCYLIVSLIFMFAIFLGNFGVISIVSLAVCFASNILIQFLIVLIMIKLGADFNYYEQRHIDLLNSNKMFIDNMYVELKYELSSGLNDYNKDINKTYGIRDSLLEVNRKNGKNIFFEILKTKEYGETDDIGNLNAYHMDSVIIYNNLSDKIRMDHILRPLRIFWIKSDYNLLNQIITLILGGIYMYLKYIIKDFEEIFKRN